MAQSSANPAHPTIPQLKPSVSQALWGHLRSMNVPPALQDKAGLSAAPAPIAPVDRAGTSMRMLLHDTQATLEKFAGHVEGLACRVDEARREVATAHKVFLHGQEKTVEENIKLGECGGAYSRAMICATVYVPLASAAYSELF